MAVSCRIATATRDAGVVHLGLEKLPDQKHGPEGNLTVLNPPPVHPEKGDVFVAGVVGTTVAISSLRVTVGGREWGQRVGANRLKLVPRRLRGGL